VDVVELEPQVACPPTVGNVKPIGEAPGLRFTWRDRRSTGGRLGDIRILAQALQGRKFIRACGCKWCR